MSGCCGSTVGRTGAERCPPHLCPSQSPRHCTVAIRPMLPPGATIAQPSREAQAVRLGVTAWDRARSSAAIPPTPTPAHTDPGPPSSALERSPGQPPSSALPLGTQGQFSQPAVGAVCQQPLLR